MCMTKKDFKAIAEIVSDKYNYIDARNATEAIIEGLDTYFKRNYPRYNSCKFLEKAGYLIE